MAALPGVQVNVTVTLELFQPAALGTGEMEAVIAGGPGAVTVTFVENVNPLTEAVIVALPVLAAAAKPLALTVATLVLDELQPTDAVRSCVLPSEYLPATVNCCVAPSGTNGFCGLMAAINNAGPATVRVVEVATLPEVAEIVVVPWPTAVTNPAELTVATVAVEEFQFTEMVRSLTVPSA